MYELSQPKRAVLSRIDANAREIQEASQSLQKPYFEDVDTVMRDDLVRNCFSFATTSVTIGICDTFHMSSVQIFPAVSSAGLTFPHV